MKLIRAQVRMFRNILDSTAVEIDPNVTCLVGKNESGKTAFLQALYRFDPVRQNASFSIPEQYPAWLEKKHRQQGKELEKVHPIEVVFRLEPADRVALANLFGPGVLPADEISLAKDYANKWQYVDGSPFDEAAAVRFVADSIKGKKAIQKTAKSVTTFAELLALAREHKGKGAEYPQEVKAGGELEAAILKALGEKSFGEVAWSTLYKRIPSFLYFAEYAKLPYTAKIKELLQAEEKDLTDEQLTARSLLRLGGADDDYLLNPDYERRKRELENVSNALTADVKQYWSTNQDLRVQPDITQREEQQGNNRHVVIDELKIRVWDDRHGLSLPFDQHSTGFRWFFSFLAAFSEYEEKDPPVIILLDEPGLGLHAKAQGDFLKFIDERLAKRCQVIYSTHSPFMVQPGKLERVRVVEDKGREKGTIVSQDVFTTDPDTLFPLQGALGYDLAQHLFVGPNNLVMEGTSDLTYFIVLSDHLRDLHRTSLDPKWSPVPVAGADMIPTFVALLGHRLDVTVVIDARKEGNQRLAHLVNEGYLSKKPPGPRANGADADCRRGDQHPDRGRAGAGVGHRDTAVLRRVRQPAHPPPHHHRRAPQQEVVRVPPSERIPRRQPEGRTERADRRVGRPGGRRCEDLVQDAGGSRDQEDGVRDPKGDGGDLDSGVGDAGTVRRGRSPQDAGSLRQLRAGAHAAGLSGLRRGLPVPADRGAQGSLRAVPVDHGRHADPQDALEEEPESELRGRYPVLARR